MHKRKEPLEKFYSEVCPLKGFLLQTQKIGFPVSSHDVGLQLRKEFSIHD